MYERRGRESVKNTLNQCKKMIENTNKMRSTSLY